MTVIAVTMGDPTGIGTELLLQARDVHHEKEISFGVVDSPSRLRKWAKKCEFALDVIEVSSFAEVSSAFPYGLPVLPLSEDLSTIYGDDPNHPTALRLTQESIERGYIATKSGEVDGLLTNPIDKSILMASDHWTAKGHTDFLCTLDGRESGDVVMMLEGGSREVGVLRVVPLTIHVPLMQAIQDISRDLIVKTVQTVVVHLQNIQQIAVPKIAVSGLNPHAGEGGALGFEEQREIKPALDILREKGYHADGPFAADTLFIPEKRQHYDAFVTMTHDQALIAVKTLYFHCCVNVTLGLSILRASPAHGVARDIVAKKRASVASWQRALLWLAEAHKNKHTYKSST